MFLAQTYIHYSSTQLALNNLVIFYKNKYNCYIVN